MFANVFTKSLRDRLPAGLVGSLAVGFFLFFAMWVYGDLDTSFYYELPEGILELVGINPDGDGAGGIAFGSMFNLMGAFTIAGLAIGWGASSIAGEEQKGTFGFLLGNPVSRRGVLVSNVVSLLLVVGIMCLTLYGAGMASAAALDISTADLHVGAVTIALFAVSAFHGLLALAIGAWTGKRGLASGVAVGIMVVGYLAASLLPLADLDGIARVFPWYYYSQASPLNNGLDWGHMAVLGALSAASLGAAMVGLQRRDLRDRGTDVTILDRLRESPLTRKVIERIAGSTRVSRISAKSISDHQGLFTVTAAIMFYMGVLIPPLYNLIPEDFINIFSTFPDALVAMIGGVDMGTPTGFLTGETFSLVGPIAIIVLAATMGSRALAGEEEKRTMGLLLSNPLRRSHVVMEKVYAMIIYCVGFGVITFGATWLGVRLAGLDEVGVSGIASISALLALFGLVYGGLALLFSAGTGKRPVATTATAAVAIVTWFIFSFFPLSDTFEPFAVASPFQWYLGSDPLLNGMDWGGAGLLVATFVMLVAASIRLFDARDLRG